MTNWGAIGAIAGPTMTAVGAAWKAIDRKLVKLAAHLDAQDDALQLHGERLARLEGPIRATQQEIQKETHTAWLAR